MPSAPIGDRRGIGDQRQAGCGERREAETDQNRAGDGDRRTEAGGAFKERAERKRDQQQLQAPVLGDAADGALQQFEPAGRNRDAVEKDDVQHDPADREEAGDDAEQRGADRHVGRHREDEDRDEVGTISAMMAAICALTLPLAISTSSVTTGIAAAIVDSAALPSGL